jgi:hypothetical protein
MRIVPCLLAAASFSLPALAAAAEFDFPPRKAGQWQIEMTPESSPAMTMDICLDEATDKQMMQAGMSISDGMCADVDVGQTGGAITIDATCTMGAVKTVSRTVMTGDFQTAYDVTTTSTIEGGPPGMPANSTIVQHARWMGPCTGGLAPGEMMMPGGMKMNVREMLGTMGGG